MAKGTPPKKKTQRTKTPTRRSTHIDFFIRRVNTTLERSPLSIDVFYQLSPVCAVRTKCKRCDLVEISNNDGIKVMCQVTSLESDINYSIVIRDTTQSFWKECIKEGKTPNMTVRVCVPRCGHAWDWEDNLHTVFELHVL